MEGSGVRGRGLRKSQESGVREKDGEKRVIATGAAF